MGSPFSFSSISPFVEFHGFQIYNLILDYCYCPRPIHSPSAISQQSAPLRSRPQLSPYSNSASTSAFSFHIKFSPPAHTLQSYRNHTPISPSIPHTPSPSPAPEYPHIQNLSPSSIQNIIHLSISAPLTPTIFINYTPVSTRVSIVLYNEIYHPNPLLSFPSFPPSTSLFPSPLSPPPSL